MATNLKLLGLEPGGHIVLDDCFDSSSNVVQTNGRLEFSLQRFERLLP